MGSIFLRVGLAFSFLYAGISSLIDAAPWIGFFPAFLFNILSENILMVGFSIFEIALAIWLISGKYIKYSASLAAMALLSIVAFNLNSMFIVFRDISLALSAAALIFIQKNKNDYRN